MLFRGFVSEIIAKLNIRVGFLPGSCILVDHVLFEGG